MKITHWNNLFTFAYIFSCLYLHIFAYICIYFAYICIYLAQICIYLHILCLYLQQCGSEVQSVSRSLLELLVVEVRAGSAALSADHMTQRITHAVYAKLWNDSVTTEERSASGANVHPVIEGFVSRILASHYLLLSQGFQPTFMEKVSATLDHLDMALEKKGKHPTLATETTPGGRTVFDLLVDFCVKFSKLSLLLLQHSEVFSRKVKCNSFACGKRMQWTALELYVKAAAFLVKFDRLDKAEVILESMSPESDYILLSTCLDVSCSIPQADQLSAASLLLTAVINAKKANLAFSNFAPSLSTPKNKMLREFVAEAAEVLSSLAVMEDAELLAMLRGLSAVVGKVIVMLRDYDQDVDLVTSFSLMSAPVRDQLGQLYELHVDVVRRQIQLLTQGAEAGSR